MALNLSNHWLSFCSVLLLPIISYLKYSEAAEANLVGATVSTSVELIRVVLARLILAIWSNWRQARVFQLLSHEVHGKVFVNDAKKNLRSNGWH